MLKSLANNKNTLRFIVTIIFLKHPPYNTPVSFYKNTYRHNFEIPKRQELLKKITLLGNYISSYR